MDNPIRPRTLSEALPAEMARVRDHVLPAFDAIGTPGVLGAAMIRTDLDRAARAAAEGDLMAMIEAHEALRGWTA